MTSWRWLVVTVLASLAFVGSGCTRKSKDLEVNVPGQGKLSLPLKETLRVRIASEPPSLDWHKATDTTSALITDNLMEGLVTYDYSKKELELAPALASKWTSKDNKTWTFTLRDGVKWSDGKALTPQHVIDGFKRLLNPATASEYAYFLYGIKNARAYSEGKIKDFALVGAKVTAPNEVTVELEKPMSFFPALMTHQATFPIRQDIIDLHGDKWTEPGNIVTLGAFNLKVWEHDKQIVLEKNPVFFGKQSEVRFVVALMIQEAATALNLFEAGKIDAMNELPATQLRMLKSRKEFKQIGSLSLYFYGFNVTKKPMDDVRVRKAISHAIDRQQIVDVLAGGQIPMTSWIPVGMFGYEADRGLNFDIDKAKVLLREAGYFDSSKLPKIELKLNTSENHQLIAENIQAQLKKNLGVDVEIKNEEWKVFLSNLKLDPPTLFRSGWLSDYADPDSFMNLMTSYSENNRTRWKNKKYDDLILKAASESDKENRRQLYSKAQKILVEDEVPAVPLYIGVTHHLVAKRLENYPINILARYKYNEVRIK